MKHISIFLIFGFLVPVLSFAQEGGACSLVGYTVATINGVFTDETGARENMQALKDLFEPKIYKNEQLNFEYLANPSHLARVGDIAKVIKQRIEGGATADEYDLVKMLSDASAKVKTRKVLLVAHSQGNFYANGIYDRVTAPSPSGESVPLESIGVYSVATPANRVAGGGRYLTSETDKIIAGLADSVPLYRIMPPNTHIELQEGDNALGHNFADIYLKYRAAEIVHGIEEALGQLTAPTPHPVGSSPRAGEQGGEDDACLPPPDTTLAHKTKSVLFAVADPVSQVALIETPRVIHATGLAIAETGTKMIAAVGNMTVAVSSVTVKAVTGIGNALGKAAVKTAAAVGSLFSGSGQEAAAAVAAGPLAILSVDSLTAAATPSSQDSGDTAQTETQTENESAAVASPVSPAEEERNQEEALRQNANDLQSEGASSVFLAPQGREEVQPQAQDFSAPEPAPQFRLSPFGGGGGGVTNASPPQTNADAEAESESAPADTKTADAAASTDAADAGDEDESDIEPPSPPVIESPTDGSTQTETAITFVGSAEAGATISNNISNTTTTADENGDWDTTLTLKEGAFDIAFTATDASGNISAHSDISVSVDSLAPSVSLSSPTCEQSLASKACLVATTTFLFSWNSSADDLSHFILDANGDVSLTTATSTAVFAAGESSYTFSVSAVDASGNTSATSTQTIAVSLMPLVINEVAWMGTAAGSADEWIELYNRTDETLSLDDFILYAKDLAPYFFLSGTIAPHGYYLIERTDDDTVSDTPADFIAPFSGSGGAGLGNSGDQLTLVYRPSGQASTTIDSMPVCTGSNTWCAGDAINHKTMERYDPDLSGALASNWYSNNTLIRNGTDADGDALLGTPRARNSANFLIAPGSLLTEDKTLTAENSPYLVPTTLTVVSGATLTLEAGVVVKIISAQEPWIRVSGTLVADGADENPVVFTSFEDDAYGGDMNHDGVCGVDQGADCPSPGGWRRLFFDTTSSASSLTHTLVRYGGNNNISDAAYYKGAVGVNGADVVFDHLVIEYSDFHGLALVDSESTVSNSRFSTSTNPFAIGAGLYVSGGAPTVSESVFNGNYRGVLVDGNATPSFFNNRFSDNTLEAASVTGTPGAWSGNSGSGNGKNAIGITGIIATANATTTLSENPLPYLVSGTVSLVKDSALAFESGVVVKGDSGAQSLSGKISVLSGSLLYASGSSPTDLVFTSMYDNSVGGTIVADGREPAAGDWKGIEVDAGARVSLSGFALSYAGAEAKSGLPAFSQNKGALKISGSLATSSGSLTNALFSNNYQSGLNLDSVSGLLVSDLTFENHMEKRFGRATALYSNNSTAAFSDIVFSGNEEDGIGVGANTLTCQECGTPEVTPPELFSP